MLKSLVIPVYKNEKSIPGLIEILEGMFLSLDGQLEVVFVVDGSPDRSYVLLAELLPKVAFPATLIQLSRNFGSFAAIRAGLSHATGEYFAVMAADLQEPPELAQQSFAVLECEPVDLVVATRETREDPYLSKLLSKTFWFFYRQLVQKEMPPGGVDVFACNRACRDQLLALSESNSSLVGLLFWVGFRRRFLSYNRKKRIHGKSAWTLQKKIKYLSDSVYSFSDLPIKVFTTIGFFGIIFSIFCIIYLLYKRLANEIPVPGYTAIMLGMIFFGSINVFGLGVIGNYVWRVFENSKCRPSFIVLSVRNFIGRI